MKRSIKIKKIYNWLIKGKYFCKSVSKNLTNDWYYYLKNLYSDLVQNSDVFSFVICLVVSARFDI